MKEDIIDIQLIDVLAFLYYSENEGPHSGHLDDRRENLSVVNFKE